MPDCAWCGARIRDANSSVTFPGSFSGARLHPACGRRVGSLGLPLGASVLYALTRTENGPPSALALAHCLDAVVRQMLPALGEEAAQMIAMQVGWVFASPEHPRASVPDVDAAWSMLTDALGTTHQVVMRSRSSVDTVRARALGDPRGTSDRVKRLSGDLARAAVALCMAVAAAGSIEAAAAKGRPI